MTFSIIAINDDRTEMAAAIASRALAVGSTCVYQMPGVGIICTQAATNRYIGLRGLQHMLAGMTSAQALEHEISQDGEAYHRQCHAIDFNGNVFAYSGDQCIAFAGHHTGEDFSIAGNYLASEDVLLSMEKTFQSTLGLPLAERVLRALEDGDAAGGDMRGRQSAALYAVPQNSPDILDLQVQDHKAPITELRRLYHLAAEGGYYNAPLKKTANL